MNYKELVKGKRYIAQCEGDTHEEDASVFPFIFLGCYDNNIEVLLLDDIDEKSERFKEYLVKILEVYKSEENSKFFDDVYEFDHDYYEELVIWGVDKESKITTCLGFEIFGFEEHPIWKVDLDAKYAEIIRNMDMSMISKEEALELGFKMGYRLAMESKAELL